MAGVAVVCVWETCMLGSALLVVVLVVLVCSCVMWFVLLGRLWHGAGAMKRGSEKEQG